MLVPRTTLQCTNSPSNPSTQPAISKAGREPCPLLPYFPGPLLPLGLSSPRSSPPGNAWWLKVPHGPAIPGELHFTPPPHLRAPWCFAWDPPGATILVGQRAPTVVGDAQPFPTTTPGTSMVVALSWDEEGEKTVTGCQRTLTTWSPLAGGGKQFSSALQSLLSRVSIPGAQPCDSTNDLLVLRSIAQAAGSLHGMGGSAPPAPSPTSGTQGMKPLAKCWTKPQARATAVC